MSYDPYFEDTEVAEAKASGEEITVEPTPAQRAWMELKFGLFVHFGINTFNDTEWSDGTLDPATFNPTEFNADQWCRAAKAAGMRYVLLVTKHHDGFTLWPSRWTDYGVQSAPFDGDVVGRVAEACERAGLKLGLYYSLWDRHEPSYDHDHSYALFMKRQLAELLTGYGPICEIWFDGGWKKGGVDWQDPYRWHWLEIYEHIKSIQPDCLVADNGTTRWKGKIVLYPCDFRIGEKGVPPEDDRTVYYCGGIGDYLPYESCYTLSTGGTGEGQFTDGKWFWHESDTTVHEPRWVVDTLEACNARGANMVLNAGPDTRGKLRDIDVACLEEVGRIRRAET